MSAEELAHFPNPRADYVIKYGDKDLQFGELRLPENNDGAPVLVLIHGGCWLYEYNLDYFRKMAAVLASEGYVTWTIEYRRVGNDGGGWPGTFNDVVDAINHLEQIAREHQLSLDSVFFAGHSAGGHLAIWAANPPSEFTIRVKPRGILALAPAADLRFLYQEGVCDGVVDKLMQGSPEQKSERYNKASGTDRLPLEVPQVIVVGKFDKMWRPVGLRYINQVKASGSSYHVYDAQESGHFEMIDPDSPTWPQIVKALADLKAMSGNR